MSIDLITKSGKKIGEIADTLDGEDTIIVNGKRIRLSDAYDHEDIKDAFAEQLKELNNELKSDDGNS